MERIIDCHTHIYPDKISEKATENVSAFYDLPIIYDGTSDSLKAQCAKNGISKCLICSVATVPEQVRSVNKFIADSVAESGGLFFGFCTLHPDMSRAEIRDELAYAGEQGLLGIKLHPDFQRFPIDDKNAYKLYEEAAADFIFLFHTGDTRYNFSEPFRLAKVMSDFPQMTAIGAHFGGWSDWENAAQVLSGQQNLYVDLSSSFYAMTPDKAVSTIRSFGADKVLFGSDYPMWDVRKEYEFLCELDIAPREREKILHGNAELLFGV
ncbi:amidohydrolase [Clostridia bacterium]|nr:amidohydrolase [Clostridia bacterium]